MLSRDPSLRSDAVIETCIVVLVEFAAGSKILEIIVSPLYPVTLVSSGRLIAKFSALSITTEQ